MSQVGSMERMYQAFRDVAEFYIVYISEAHAADDRSPVGYAKELGINEHKNYGERCSVATRLQAEKKLTIPCLIDGMDNAVEASYKGWPDRVFLIRKDGRLAIAGKRGPWGFKPGIDRAEAWLASYKETGREPAVVMDDGPDVGELMSSFYGAMRRSDYDTAMKVGTELHEAMPDDVGTMYNLACVHSLSAKKGGAYRWLEKAVAAGYTDADHAVEDDDLKPLRGEQRFENLIQRMRELGSSAALESLDPAAFTPVLGNWDMVTAFNGNAMEATMTLSIQDGAVVGVWRSQGREMPLSDIVFSDATLTFTRSMGPDMALRFEGTVDGDRIQGKYTSPFGEMASDGTRK